MTNTPLTPPEAPQPGNVPPAVAPQGVASGTKRSAAVTAITIVTAVIGGVALLGAGATAAWGTGSQLLSSSAAHSVDLDITGITELDVEAAGVEFILQFDDVSTATLDVSGRARGEWTMRRDGDELIIKHPEGVFGWWFGSWPQDDQVVTLTLPNALNKGTLDATLNLSAGSLRADGNFDELDIEVSAGALRVDAAATSLSAQVSAGDANITVSGVDDADLGVSAGKLVAELTGSAPDDVSVDVSAGQMVLTLPNAEYAVSQNVDAGGIDNNLRINSSSQHEVTVAVSAGSVKLRSGN